VHRSLTVLLPVRNVQSTLRSRVMRALETASELAERFEVVVVDDGSTDDTCEVAFELARDYPQVQAVRHGRRLGHEAAVRSGFSRSQGETVLLAIDEAGSGVSPPPVSFEAFAREDEQEKCPRGFRLLDRGLLERLSCASRPSRPNYLAKWPRAAPIGRPTGSPPSLPATLTAASSSRNSCHDRDSSR